MSPPETVELETLEALAASFEASVATGGWDQPPTAFAILPADHPGAFPLTGGPGRHRLSLAPIPLAAHTRLAGALNEVSVPAAALAAMVVTEAYLTELGVGGAHREEIRLCTLVRHDGHGVTARRHRTSGRVHMDRHIHPDDDGPAQGMTGDLIAALADLLARAADRP